MARNPFLLFMSQSTAAHLLKRHPTLVTKFFRPCHRNVGRFAAAISRADVLLGRTRDSVMENLLATFGPGDAERHALETAVRSSPVSRNLFVGRQSSYREVGTLAHLFTRVRRKGALQSDNTELAKTNQMRLVSIAEMQQMAQDVHDSVVTTAAGEPADLEAVTTANKLTVLLGNALFSLAFKTATDMKDMRVLTLLMLSLERFSSSCFEQEGDRPERPGLQHRSAALKQRWRHQARSTEPLANAFECSLLLSGAGAEERAAARKCGTDLALAMQALKELNLFLNEGNEAAVDSRSLPVIITQESLNEATKSGMQQQGERDAVQAAVMQREYRDVAGEVSSVIWELTDGVLAYAADCEMSDDLAAFQDIVTSLRGP